MFKKAFVLGMTALTCMAVMTGCPKKGDKVADRYGNLTCCGKATLYSDKTFTITGCSKIGNVSGDYIGPAHGYYTLTANDGSTYLFYWNGSYFEWA